MRKILFAVAALIPALAFAAGPVSADEAMVKIVGYPNRSISPPSVSVSGVTARTNAGVAEYSIVRIFCSTDTHVALGGSTVTAAVGGGFIVAGGLPELFNVGPNTYLAFITEGATGSCQVSVLQ